MADRYIDSLEVGEYGDHFVARSKELDGLSPLVDVPALRAKVQAAIDGVDQELGKIGVKRGALRTGRGATDAAAAEGRDLIQRFYYTLRGLPASSGVDVAAFFPDGLLGDVTGLKPADVKGRLSAMLKGFETDANKAAAASFGAWPADLQAGHDTLAAALAEKGGSVGTSITGTATLNAAREHFLWVYNRVAKKLVSGLLADVKREGEYELFFKDLTVNEGGKKAAPASAGEDGGAGEGDGAGAP